MKLKWIIKTAGYHLGISDLFFFFKVFATFILKKPHEEDFVLFSKLTSKIDFVDVGANAGQSVLSFKMFSRSSQVVSFEPNPAHRRHLRLLRLIFKTSFRYEIQGLGNESRKMTLFIPTVAGVPLTQEATFERLVLEEDIVTGNRIRETTGRQKFVIKPVSVQISRFDDLKLQVDVVKLDCQGYEIEVLKGMAETLRLKSPLLMIENSELFGAMKSFLKTLDYKPYSFDQKNCRLVPCQELSNRLNVFFAPSIIPQKLAPLFS